MTLPQKAVDEYRVIYKKVHGIELDDKQATEYANGTFNFIKIFYDMEIEELKRKHMLKEHPKGYHFDDNKQYSCPLCHTSMKNEQIWYDDCGMKCMTCQWNLNKKIIPKSVFKDSDSYWHSWEIEKALSVKSPTVRRLVREGELKARILQYPGGGDYQYIFLKKENINSQITI